MSFSGYKPRNLMKNISRFILHNLMGWNTINTFPQKLKKYIIIVAPHTSWLDFPIGVLGRFALGIKGRFIGKHTLFKPPFGFIFRSLGGTPVDRSKSVNRVQSIIDIFDDNKEFILAISPEGTRKKINKWKTGFYYVAKGANVPIIMVGLDYKIKKIIVSNPFDITGDIENDFLHFHEFYKDINAKHPGKFESNFHKNM